MDRTHNKNKRKTHHQCDFCTKSFSSLQYLKHHIQSIHCGIQENKCDFCGKLFSTPTVLKKHIHTIHEGNKDHNKCKSEKTHQ